MNYYIYYLLGFDSRKGFCFTRYFTRLMLVLGKIIQKSYRHAERYGHDSNTVIRMHGRDSKRIANKQEAYHTKNQALFECDAFTFVAGNTSCSCICGLRYSLSTENTHMFIQYLKSTYYTITYMHTYTEHLLLNTLYIYMKMNKTDCPPSRFAQREPFAQHDI